MLVLIEYALYIIYYKHIIIASCIIIIIPVITHIYTNRLILRIPHITFNVI